jgi:hypothetical protein
MPNRTMDLPYLKRSIVDPSAWINRPASDFDVGLR